MFLKNSTPSGKFWLWFGAILVAVGGTVAFVVVGRPIYRCSDCNVIVVSIDTLRRDHLSVYGYDRQTSPNLDAFSKDATLFDTAISQAPSTTPSHASLFTSLIPIAHGAFVSRKSAIRSDVKTMAEILHENGFKTASFNGGAQMSSVFGFGRGFDIYKSFTGADYTQERFKDRVHEGIEWLEQNKKDKFFLFLHSYDIHHPYAPDPQNLALFKDPAYSGPVTPPIDANFLLSVNRKRRTITEADREFIVSAYDAEIRGADEGFGELIEYLRKTGLYDKTIIVFSSDHGEEFNEHGWVGWHSHSLYDELLRVPLLIKFPTQLFAGTKISQQVRNIDMLPTVLDVLGVSALSTFQGRTLMRLVQGKDDSKIPTYAISQKDGRGRTVPTSVRTTEWKLTNKRLFDLKQDPREKKNVAEQHPEVVVQLKEWRDEILRSSRKH